MKSVKLSSGFDMPMVGLGTWQAKPEEVETAVKAALDNGYRHIDTAYNYRNEDSIGKALKQWFESGGKREEVFITTKLPHYGNRPSDVEKYLNFSLNSLGLDYIDLYLVHMPFAVAPDATGAGPLINDDGSFEFDVESNPVAVWKEMEKQVKRGKARSIGVSNFSEDQIREILKNAEIKPSNLQVELHAYHQQKAVRKFCAENGIAVTAYSPLASPGAKAHFEARYNYKFSSDDFPDLLTHPVVKRLAEVHNKTTSQVLLRHLIQENIIIIPKSASPERIKLNIDIYDFELSPKEIEELDSLDRAANGRIFTFLFFKGIENHPYYPFKNELP